MRTNLILSMVAAMAATFWLGCSEEDADGPVFPDAQCDFEVESDGDDQTRLRQVLIGEAVDGDVICLASGNYPFLTELQIDQDGVTLIGNGMHDTVLDFTNQDSGGNGILVTGNNVTIRDLRVSNTPGDSIRANNVDNIAFINVSAWWDTDPSVDPEGALENGAYGLYPVGCDGVLIDGCEAVGSRDAGIYVGQSSNILVKDSVAYHNVAGIEIENSFDAEVVNNHAYDNTAGILVFNLPGPPVQGGERCIVHGNNIENNNLGNFAEAGTTVAVVPPGTGVMILSSDNNEVTDNDIVDNISVGVLLVTYTETLFGSWDNDDFDSFTEGNYIHGNRFTNNGTDPTGMMSAVANGAGTEELPEVVYDGCHRIGGGPDPFTPNCMQEDPAIGWLDLDFCNSFAGMSTDAADVDCSYPALPSQTGRTN